MKEVIIRRSRWCRGGRAAAGAALRTESGQSCCLGFVARAYGLKTPVGKGVFSDLAKDKQDCSVLPSPLRPLKRKSDYVEGEFTYLDTNLHDKLTEANDSSTLKSAEREKRIAALLAKAGIKAIFVD
jgi:hypothetical protein